MRQQRVIILGNHSQRSSTYLTVDFSDLVGVQPLLVVDTNTVVHVKLILFHVIKWKYLAFSFILKVLSVSQRNLIRNSRSYWSTASVRNSPDVIFKEVFYSSRIR